MRAFCQTNPESDNLIVCLSARELTASRKPAKLKLLMSKQPIRMFRAVSALQN